MRDRSEDGRERAYEGRDQTGDPRDMFLHDVDLPMDREREYVFDREQLYERNKLRYFDQIMKCDIPRDWYPQRSARDGQQPGGRPGTRALCST